MKRKLIYSILVFIMIPGWLKGQYFETGVKNQENKKESQEYLSQEEIKNEGPILGRIVGGSNAVISDYPWQVALMSSSGYQFCAGSVIHPEWILTAAHCLGGTIYVRAGVTNRTDNSGQDRLVIQQYTHPGFIDSDHINDIALLKLQSPLDLSGPNVKAIPIVTAAHAELGYTDPGTVATITGWGALSEGGPSTNILQHAQVPITTQEYAETHYAPYGYDITPDMLPAGYPQGGVDACQGDSGGPIVVPDDEHPLGFRLAGATSWGIGCARPGLPGLYARASVFESWIKQVSGIEFEQPSGLLNPTQFIAQAVSVSQIHLSWIKNTDQNNVMILWSENGTFGTPQDGVAYLAGQTIPGGGQVLYRGGLTSYNHTNLEPATYYYYKAFSYNLMNEYSLGTTTMAGTLCNSLSSLPYQQNFNASNSTPVCWEVVDNIGNGQVWQFGTFSQGLSGTTGNYAYLNSDGYGSGNSQNSDLVSPEFDFTNYTNINIAFNHFFRSYTGSSATLQYSINKGATWTTIQQWTTGTTNPAYFSRAIPALSGKPSVLFRWKYIGTWGYYWSVDNVAITGIYDPQGIQVDIKVALEGAVNPSGSPLLTTSINSLLPNDHPYYPTLPYFNNPDPVWYYTGDETAGSIGEDIVDWVLVELRQAATSALAVDGTDVATKAALLRNDGMIVDVSGSPLTFDVSPSNNLFVVVFHRNHLAVMSAQPMTNTQGIFTYDFTSGPSQAFGGPAAQKQALPGLWVMIGGDGDGNGQVQSQDKNNVWDQQAGSSGYYAGDFDMNGQVQTQDKNEIWEQNSGLGSAIP